MAAATRSAGTGRGNVRVYGTPRRSKKGVATTPGMTTENPTGERACSWRSDSVKAASAALQAAYTASPRPPAWPAIDPTLTTCPQPRPTIPGRSARVRRSAAVRSTCTSREISASGISANSPAQPTPALFTSTSTRPCTASAEAASCAAAPSAARSATSAVPPARAAAASVRPGSDPAASTRAPRDDRAKAVAAPIPLDAPVTRHTDPRTSTARLYPLGAFPVAPGGPVRARPGRGPRPRARDRGGERRRRPPPRAHGPPAGRGRWDARVGGPPRQAADAGREPRPCRGAPPLRPAAAGDRPARDRERGPPVGRPAVVDRPPAGAVRGGADRGPGGDRRRPGRGPRRDPGGAAHRRLGGGRARAGRGARRARGGARERRLAGLGGRRHPPPGGAGARVRE